MYNSIAFLISQKWKAELYSITNKHIAQQTITDFLKKSRKSRTKSK